MQFILSTGSLYTYGTERCFAVAAEVGFDGIELMVDQRWDTRQPTYLKTLMDRYQLPIVAVHSPFSGVHQWPKEQPGLIEQSLKLAKAIDAKIVVHHLPRRVGFLNLSAGFKSSRIPVPFWRDEQGYKKWLEQEYSDLQAKTTVKLCIENMPAYRWGKHELNIHHWNNVKQITRFPTLTMDTTHLGTWGLEPVEVYAQWKEKIAHVHLSNFDGAEHRLPEKGWLHLDQLIAAMSANGYSGAISLELHPDTVRAGSSDIRVGNRLRKSLLACRSWIS